MAHSQISLGFQGWADCSISSADFKTVELSVSVAAVELSVVVTKALGVFDTIADGCEKTYFSDAFETRNGY